MRGIFPFFSFSPCFTYVKCCHLIPRRFICNISKTTCLLHEIGSRNSGTIEACTDMYYTSARNERKSRFYYEHPRNGTIKNRTVKRSVESIGVYSGKGTRKWNVNRVQKRKSCTHADCNVDSPLTHVNLGTVKPRYYEISAPALHAETLNVSFRPSVRDLDVPT